MMLYAAAPTQQQITQLMDITHVDQISQKTIQQLRPVFQQQADGIVKNYVKKTELNHQEQQIANEIAEKLYQNAIRSMDWKKLQPILETVYREVFDAKEIQAQINFYSTPEGQSILQKSPLLAQKTLELMNTQLMQSMQSSEAEFAEINQKLAALKPIQSK